MRRALCALLAVAGALDLPGDCAVGAEPESLLEEELMPGKEARERSAELRDSVAKIPDEPSDARIR